MGVIREVTGMEVRLGPHTEWIVSEDLGRQYIVYLVSRQAIDSLNLDAAFWQGESVSVLQAQFGLLTSDTRPGALPGAHIICRLDMFEKVITVEIEAKGVKHPLSFAEAARCLASVYGVPEGQVHFEFWLSEIASNKANLRLCEMLRLGS